MDLHSNSPFWLLRNGIKNVYPSLSDDVHADVTIIGGGITGALVAYHLSNAGFSVNVVDKRHIGFGSTAACTGLLQYEIDTPLQSLVSKVGEANAVRSYELCLDSLASIKKIICSLDENSGYADVPSLQFASFKSHLKNLRLEYEMRKKFRIAQLEWLEPKDVIDLFFLESSGAILSQQGATIDAYAFTHALLRKSIESGIVNIFDSTLVESIEHGKRKVTLNSSDGFKLTSWYLVIACGYESQKYLSRQVEIANSTYTIISEPFQQKEFWHKNAMIWETADPYLYLRRTEDNRIIVGGKDDKFYNPAKRDRKLRAKANSLRDSFLKLYPSFEYKTDFSWAGYFSKTKDGLPYIGTVRERPNTFFALGFGGNGVVFSVIAAEMITDVLSGKKNPDMAIFSFDR